MEIFGIVLSYFILFGCIYSSYCSEDLTLESASPLKGLDENNFFVKNVLFTSNGNKNLNIKFWLLHFQYDFGYFSDNIPNFLNDMEIYIDQSKESYETEVWVRPMRIMSEGQLIHFKCPHPVWT